MGAICSFKLKIFVYNKNVLQGVYHDRQKYIIALDQGTTSSRAVLLDHNANIVEIAQREFTQIYPRAGWVEHNPMEIWATQSSTLNEVVAKAGITSDEIAAIGITNQRETTIVWEKQQVFLFITLLFGNVAVLRILPINSRRTVMKIIFVTPQD
ncbi:glycerol kinase [Rodentibacter pneumotropicus]|uniref:Glycerol kinase n=1 Tax=Rodentibacter pneumotropicus TaxID=758 RepID=A0A3S4ULX6_9PAST|nr:glycerol kinase [Rodentibacter pneumotropicus]